MYAFPSSLVGNDLQGRCGVVVGADPCVRPNDAGILWGVAVGTGRDLSLQTQDLDIVRHSGESRNPERTGMDEGAGFGDPMEVAMFLRLRIFLSLLDSGMRRNDDQRRRTRK